MNTVANKYWNNTKLDPEIDGVAPMGGCGRLEIYYRNYFENKRFKQIAELKGKSLLEIGCGAGRWALNLSQLLFHYDGIDISSPSIDFANKLINTRNIQNCKFYNCNIKNFNTQIKYDIIYFSGVTQYIENDELALIIKIVKSLLKPGGIIIDRSTITLEPKTKIGRRDNYYCIYRTSDDIKNVFEKEGFKLMHQQRTYRFLRLNKLKYIYNNKVIWFLNIVPSVWFNVLEFITHMQDILSPKIFREDICGSFSHDFFVFSSDEKK